MSQGPLFLSFWHVNLENLPVGTFVHRIVTRKDAGRLIKEARRQHRLHCVSHDDILAPYHEKEKRDHEKLCRVLGEHCDIALSLEDFVVADEVDGELTYMIRPLQFAEIEGSSRLLVVNCHYVIGEKREKSSLTFAIAPESLTFHEIAVYPGGPSPTEDAHGRHDSPLNHKE